MDAAPTRPLQAPPPAPPSAGASFARDLAVMVAVCGAIAGLMALIWGGPGGKLVYSFSIGLSCWGVIAALEQVAGWLWRRVGGAPARGLWSHRVGKASLIAVGTVAGGSLGLAIADAVVGGDSPPLWDWRSRGSQVTLMITLLATVVAVLVMGSRERLARLQAQAEAARRAAAESELRLLQSQLEPHMLFNTLANLRVLIGLDTARAQAMLDRLIAYLRATLAASRLPRHPLAAEFARVDDYLALMAVRMDARLQVRLELPDALRDRPVPPLLLQPLVENAIRHGLEPAVAGGRITVAAQREGDRLRLSVHDTGVGLGASPHRDGTRFGLAQVRERLRTLYGEAATVELGPAPEGGVTRAMLRLPLEPAAMEGGD